MRRTLALIFLFLLGVYAQEEDSPTEDAGKIDEEEECEEAWDYVEFMKKEIK